jgi:hypothetical protein
VAACDEEEGQGSASQWRWFYAGFHGAWSSSRKKKKQWRRKGRNPSKLEQQQHLLLLIFFSHSINLPTWRWCWWILRVDEQLELQTQFCNLLHLLHS